MKCVEVLALGALLQVASAHYRFTSLVVGGKNTGDYVDVRQNSNYNSPVTNVASNDMICNSGALTGRNTSIVTVAAGSPMSFALDQAVYHDGPATVWISKAPGDVSDYDGSGEWAKIFEVGATFSPGKITFPASGKKQIDFTIPACTAPGDYLVRVEQIGLHVASSKGGAQFYIACGQIEVTGSGGGSFSPTVKFPGVYDGTEPGILINIYNPVPTSYTIPGGPVAKC